MKKERDYTQDIEEIRSMMERTSKFLSLSGWAGILAGCYALAGVYFAYNVLHFNPHLSIPAPTGRFENLAELVLLGLAVLSLSLGTAIILSLQKARSRGEELWNRPTKRLVQAMAVPLIAGGVLLSIFIYDYLLGFLPPASLLFYGLALFNASQFTYKEVKYLGLLQITLGLLGFWMVEWSLWFWAAGFGFAHIFYGLSVHYKYES